MCCKKVWVGGEVQTDVYHARFPMLYSFNCYHKKVTAESTEYSVRTQKAQYQIDLLMADSSRFRQHVFTKPSQMLPGSFNFVINLVIQPMMIPSLIVLDLIHQFPRWNLCISFLWQCLSHRRRLLNVTSLVFPRRNSWLECPCTCIVNKTSFSLFPFDSLWGSHHTSNARAVHRLSQSKSSWGDHQGQVPVLLLVLLPWRLKWGYRQLLPRIRSELGWGPWNIAWGGGVEADPGVTGRQGGRRKAATLLAFRTLLTWGHLGEGDVTQRRSLCCRWLDTIEGNIAVAGASWTGGWGQCGGSCNGGVTCLERWRGRV